MSEPKRYRLDPESYLTEHPQGDFVDYQDYARLKAEVEELKRQPDPLTAYLYAAELGKDAIKKLKAEVERLTALVESNLNSSKIAIGKADAVLHERESLKAEVERLDNLVRYWSEKYQNENARFLRACKRIKAKEGKPSA